MATKSKGRQKIVMAKMSKESNLKVTFSKRRSGLFKNASELSTLCGVEIAIIVFSPRKIVFSFGYSNVEQIFDKFLNAQNPSPTNLTMLQLVHALSSARVRLLNTELSQLLNYCEEQKKQREELVKLSKQRQDMFWWETPVDDLRFEQLDRLKTGMEDLKRNIATQAQNLVMMEQALALDGYFL
nr:PREDICTED: agamous-like MADS-box protein AGL62 [Daucus carota subsp. sativus]